MLPFVESLVRQITLATLLDIAITAFFIYWLFSLIRGTRAVTLVIGVTILFGAYALAQWLHLRMFTQLLQAGAVVGLFALVVVFQPELRRALERIGRVGAIGRVFAPPAQRRTEHVAAEVSKAAWMLSRERHGALIVIERETGLEEIAETGVMMHADLSHELLSTIFMPRTELHDGAVIIRGDAVLAAAALLPLTEMDAFGTLWHPAPGRAGDHRGHRRGRRRRVRGERPDEPRRAGPDRPDPERGPARASADRTARDPHRLRAPRSRGIGDGTDRSTAPRAPSSTHRASGRGARGSWR